MTLILTMGNSEQVVHISDRRYTYGTGILKGKPLNDEAIKDVCVLAPGIRLIFSISGLASCQSFDTAETLCDILSSNLPNLTKGPEIYLSESMEAFWREVGSHRYVKKLPYEAQAIEIISSGYVFAPDGPVLCALRFSNRYNPAFDPMAQDQGEGPYFWFHPPLAGVSAGTRKEWLETGQCVFWAGNTAPITQKDDVPLRDMLHNRASARALIGKGCSLLREIADRPAALGNIGKNYLITVLPSDPSKSVQSSQEQDGDLSTAIMSLLVSSDGSTTMQFRSIKIRYDEKGTRPIAKRRKIGRNEPCPCGSGRKYKRCCLPR